jgi:hypothetical protein
LQVAEHGAEASVFVTSVLAFFESFFDSVAFINKTTTNTKINKLPMLISSFFILNEF